MTKRCNHLEFVNTDRANSRGCEECIKLGDPWVPLRLRRADGNVGCCNGSNYKHATKHFDAIRHPVITSIEPGEHQSWCFIDALVMELR